MYRGRGVLPEQTGDRGIHIIKRTYKHCQEGLEKRIVSKACEMRSKLYVDTTGEIKWHVLEIGHEPNRRKLRNTAVESNAGNS